MEGERPRNAAGHATAHACASECHKCASRSSSNPPSASRTSSKCSTRAREPPSAARSCDTVRAGCRRVVAARGWVALQPTPSSRQTATTARVEKRAVGVRPVGAARGAAWEARGDGRGRACVYSWDAWRARRTVGEEGALAVCKGRLGERGRVEVVVDGARVWQPQHLMIAGGAALLDVAGPEADLARALCGVEGRRRVVTRGNLRRTLRGNPHRILRRTPRTTRTASGEGAPTCVCGSTRARPRARAMKRASLSCSS